MKSKVLPVGRQGFTIPELLVVVGIIALLTALLLPAYKEGGRNLSLQRAANKLSQDIRRTQDFAISAKEFNGVVANSYGIYFNISDNRHYIIFADLDGGKDYDASEAVETVEIEKNVQLASLAPAGPLTIVFSSPDPTVEFFPDAPTVSVAVKISNTAIQKTIEANKAGLIYVND